MDVSALVVAAGSAIAAILGAYALVVKARSAAARPRHVLARLWDWIETRKLADEVPAGLAASVRNVLAEETDDDPTP